MTSTRRDQVSHPNTPPSNLLGIYRGHPNSFRKKDTQIVHPDCDTFKTWNWTDLDKKAKLLYSLWFKLLCPGVLILQNAACREVQTVLRADVSLGQCPAGHPSARDSIPSQVQHWRITHSWASAFEKQGLQLQPCGEVLQLSQTPTENAADQAHNHLLTQRHFQTALKTGYTVC